MAEDIPCTSAQTLGLETGNGNMSESQNTDGDSSPDKREVVIKKEIVEDDDASASFETQESLVNSLKCPICKLDFKRQPELDEHLRKHGLPLRCFYCQDVLPDVTSLDKHRAACPKLGRLRCCFHCGKSFANIETLLAHEYLLHQPANSSEKYVPTDLQQPIWQTYACSVCYEKYEGFAAMQQHLGEHLESLNAVGKDLECGVCSIVYVSRAALSTHLSSPRHREKVMRIKSLFKCNHCGTVFPSRDGYAMHMLDIAREESENELERKTIGLFVSLKHTGVSGSESSKLQNHADGKAASVHEDDDKVPSVVIKQEPVDPDSETKPPESCDGSGSVYGSSEERRTTEKIFKNVIDTNERYKCGLCKKNLHDQDAFAMHMMHHARTMEEQHQRRRIMGQVREQPLDLRPLKSEPDGPDEDVTYRPALGVVCSYCLVPFVTRDALAMHMMEEHADTTYESPHTFDRKLQTGYEDSPQDALKARRASYPCQVCGRSFHDQDNLAMHMLMHSQSELLLLAQKPSSTINLSELSSSPRSTQSATSPSQSQSEDWQKTILNVLYKDMPGKFTKYDKEAIEEGQSEGASTKSFGSTSDTTHVMATSLNRHQKVRYYSLDNQNSEGRHQIEFGLGQYDRNVITFDRDGQKWTCVVCCVEFRSLITVTRHLGHVSHKLEVERRLRDVLPLDKSPSWQARLKEGTVEKCVACRWCGKRYPNQIELKVHTALFCQVTGAYPKHADGTFNPDRICQEGAMKMARPRSTQSCHEQSDSRVLDIPRKRRMSEDLSLGREKVTRSYLPIRSGTLEKMKGISSKFHWNLNSSGVCIQSKGPPSVDSSASHMQMPLRVHAGVSEADSNTDNDSNSDVMDYILKQKELFMCKFCKIIFTDKTVYYLHMGLHNLNNPWQCNLCGKPCADVHEFSSHVIHY